MKTHLTLLAGVVLAATTALVGAVHGRFTNRWGKPVDMQSAGKRLEKLPDQIDGWQAVRDSELDERVAQMLQCSGAINRVYENVKTGDRIMVFVVLGPAGPIAVHTPEICYSSKDFQINAPRRKWSLDDDNDLWDLHLTANDLSGQSLRVLYGWTNDQHWHATEYPRFAYGGRPLLYKLQIAGPPAVDEGRDPCREFLTAFVPVLRKHLVDPS